MMTEKFDQFYKQAADLNQLETSLNYQFMNRMLLITALTHRSFTHEQPNLTLENNQRLEFLGDAVLGLSVAANAFTQEANLSEGQMTKLRAAVVCEESLADCAQRISLAEYLQLGNGEIVDGGREKPSILADAMEAIFGAIFLESGFSCAEACINNLFRPYIALALAGKLSNDYKTALLEYAQGLAEPLPVEFKIVASDGPVHKKVYTAQVKFGAYEAEGSGGTKKQAEQQAAKHVLNML